MNSRLAEKLQQGCPSQISLEGRQVANEIKVPKTALGNGLAFKRLDAFGSALPFAISVSSASLSIGARQPVRTVFAAA
jgi:hypothetical protein